MQSKYIKGLMIIFLLAGCGEAKYYEKHDSVDVTQGIQREVTVRVLAEAEDWLNSGAIVKAGKQYKIEAAGRWHGGTICGWTGPDGIGASKMCFFHIIPGWSISTLIAKINEEGAPFAVGSDYTFVAARDGVLYFHINEPSSTFDNQGFVTVKISSPHVTQDVIDVKIIGYDSGVKTTKQQNYREAVLNAKRQAIERAGVEVKSTSKVKNFKLEEDYIETNAQAILMPGFEIFDIGYTEGGTYNVMLIGKIKITGLVNR